MMNQYSIKKNFTKSAELYDMNASFQRYAADKLFNIIISNLPKNSQPIRILEIGCGTGFLTEKLFQHYANADFLICDISSAMVEKCRKNTVSIRSSNDINVQFSVCDISNKFPDGNFDLIVSGLTFQWLTDLATTLKSVNTILSSNGFLFFSTVSNTTFDSLKRLFKQQQVPFPGPYLLSTEEILNACKTVFCQSELFQEIYYETHPSVMSLLKKIQQTGTGNPNKKKLSPGSLKKIIHRSDDDNVFTAEYSLVNVTCNKSQQ